LWAGPGGGAGESYFPDDIWILSRYIEFSTIALMQHCLNDFSLIIYDFLDEKNDETSKCLLQGYVLTALTSIQHNFALVVSFKKLINLLSAG
jgi:hypothetical protein